MNQFRVVLDAFGVRSVLFVCTNTEAGACSLLAARFPTARIIRVSEAR